jgi:hypothetical protein
MQEWMGHIHERCRDIHFRGLQYQMPWHRHEVEEGEEDPGEVVVAEPGGWRLGVALEELVGAGRGLARERRRRRRRRRRDRQLRWYDDGG